MIVYFVSDCCLCLLIGAFEQHDDFSLLKLALCKCNIAIIINIILIIIVITRIVRLEPLTIQPQYILKVVRIKENIRCKPQQKYQRDIGLGAVSIRKTVLPGMVIPMLKIRRPNGRLIFNMEIAILR